MPNLIGDNIETLYRGGASNIEWSLNRGVNPPNWYTLNPSSWNGSLFEEIPTVDEGLDGKLDEKWWTYRLTLQFFQVDEQTMDDLYSGTLDPLMRATGISTRITLLTGQVLTLNMRWRKRFVAGGYNTIAYVELTGTATTAVSVFQ